MKKYKILLKVLLVVLLISTTPVFAKNYLSETDLDAINELINYRLFLTTMDSKEALKEIEDYRRNLLSTENQQKFTEQGILVLDTLLTLEEVNYLYNLGTNPVELKIMLFPKNDELENWINNHQEEGISPWVYTTAGDLLSCSLNLYPTTKLIDIGYRIKRYYEAALKENPNMTYGNLSLAQWYFYAPIFGGGSKKKAKTLFENALANAITPGEKFYANLYYSQFLLDQKDKIGSENLLFRAQQIEPNSKKIQFIKLLNQNGYTLFYYMLNRDKIDKKLGLQN